MVASFKGINANFHDPVIILKKIYIAVCTHFHIGLLNLAILLQYLVNTGFF